MIRKKIKEMFEDVLKGKITVSEFSEKYEDFINDKGDKLGITEKGMHEDLIEDIAYFEPNPEIRKDDPSLIDEKQLRGYVKITWKKLYKDRL